VSYETTDTGPRNDKLDHGIRVNLQITCSSLFYSLLHNVCDSYFTRQCHRIKQVELLRYGYRNIDRKLHNRM